MTTTVQNLLDRIRRDYLTQGRVEPRNKLSVAINDTETSLVFQYELGNISTTSYLSVGLEDMYVWSVDPTSKSIVVDRGIDGSTASSHTTDERVRVTPRWTDSQILRAVNAELDNMYAQGIYAVDTTEFTYTSAYTGYEMPADTMDVMKVQSKNYAFNDWVRVEGWEYRTAQSTDMFASGSAIYLRGGAFQGQPVQVTYRKQFTALSSLSQVVETVSGIPATAVDVLAMGTAITLLVGREVSMRLLEYQGSTRRAEEVPPGSLAQAITPIIRQYQARVRAERTALVRRYGL